MGTAYQDPRTAIVLAAVMTVEAAYHQQRTAAAGWIIQQLLSKASDSQGIRSSQYTQLRNWLYQRR